jgi:hypothetical protein
MGAKMGKYCGSGCILDSHDTCSFCVNFEPRNDGLSLSGICKAKNKRVKGFDGCDDDLECNCHEEHRNKRKNRWFDKEE